MNFKIFHMGGLIKVTLFTSTTCKKLFKHFSFYLLTFLSWTLRISGLFCETSPTAAQEGQTSQPFLTVILEKAS